MPQKYKHSLFFLFAMCLCCFSFPANANEPAKPECYDFADPVRVKVGETEFHIPNKFHPVFFVYKDGQARSFGQESCRCYDQKNEDNKTVSRQGYCQEPNQPAFEIGEFFIRSKYFGDERQNYFPELLGNLDIQISRKRQEPIDSYCETKNKIDGEIEKWKRYEKAPDFFEAPKQSSINTINGSIYYFSEKHHFFGFPILIECLRQEQTIPSRTKPPINEYAQSDSIGRRCQFLSVVGSAVGFKPVIDLGDKDDFLHAAPRGSIVYGGTGKDTFELGSDYLIGDAAVEDKITYQGKQIYGGVTWKGQESPWAKGLYGIKYALSDNGSELVIKNLSGKDTYLAGFFDQLSGQTAGIRIGEISMESYRLRDTPKNWQIYETYEAIFGYYLKAKNDNVIDWIYPKAMVC